MLGMSDSRRTEGTQRTTRDGNGSCPRGGGTPDQHRGSGVTGAHRWPTVTCPTTTQRGQRGAALGSEARRGQRGAALGVRREAVGDGQRA